MGLCQGRQIAPGDAKGGKGGASGRAGASSVRGAASAVSTSTGFSEHAGEAHGAAGGGRKYEFHTILDRFETFEEVAEALRAAGLESSNLVIAVDFTKSNQWTGRHSFGGECLHALDRTGGRRNPYQKAIEIIGKTLAGFDDDNLIPTFGFGDHSTSDKTVFPFLPDRPCRGFEEVLTRYEAIVPELILAGPTSFAPAIEATIEIVKRTRSYHILLIVADGQVTVKEHTISAIVEASKYPISIVVVGVGDGPWDTMMEFDDELPQRRFDNFQFVNYTKVMAENPRNPDVSFAVAALMEIAEQYEAIRSLKLL